MASRLLRRSGIAVGLVADVLGWRADGMYQVGIGHYHEEVDVLTEEWPGLKVFGCEPHPEILRELLKNGKYKGLICPVAVSNVVGTQRIYAKRRHAEGASFYRPRGEDADIVSFDVPVTTLDLLFPEPAGEHVLLWLDCEGNELKVLEGGPNLLKMVEVANVEMTSNPPGLGWCRPLEVQRFMEGAGFFAQWVHTQRIGSGQCDWTYVRPKLFKPEFCCFPWEVERYLIEMEVT